MAGAAPAHGAAAAPMVDSPQYQAWAKFKPGSSTTMTATMTMSGMNMEVTTTSTLVSVTPDLVTLSIASKVTMMGQAHPSPAQQKTLPAKIPQQDVKQVGTADVTAAGKTYPCKILEVNAASAGVGAPSRGGASTPASGATAKIYVNDTVPGGAVKIEVAAPSGLAMTFTLASVVVK